MKKEGKRMDKKASVAIELQVLDYAIFFIERFF